MEIKEKVKNYYAGMGVKVDNDYIERILKDSKRTNEIIRLYKQEEVNKMNIMFDKEIGNSIFTREELTFANQFDLSDEHIEEVARLIWKYRNNKRVLKLMQNIVQTEGVNDYDNILGGAINANNN
jgi:hypothetical protein|nr:MAG TPA: hypothetical protein [Caudoviricetes sp.]